MKTIDCKQGTEQWWLARQGIPTASNFHKILTAKTLKLSAQADDYINELIGDCFMNGAPEEASFMTKPMEHGVETEREARAWYALQNNTDVEPVGFCVSDDGRFGCSPDGLMRNLRRGLELKCPLPKTHIAYLRAAVLPPEYKAQVHGSLIVTGYDEWDFVSYPPVVGLPPLCITVKPDGYTDALRAALDAFHPIYMAARKQMEALRPAEQPVEEIIVF